MLSHDTRGDPDGRPILMVHPLGADGSFWNECRLHFGGSVFTVACDLRGSGASPDLDSPLTLETTIADLEELRLHLRLDKLVLMGCAVGAMAAALYAVRHPNSTAGLILSNPGIRITPQGAADLQRRAALVRASGMAALMPQAIENAFTGFEDTARRHAYEARFVRQNPASYAFAVEGAANADITRWLSEIACPVLLTPGRNDRLFGLPHSREIEEFVGQCEVAEFADGSHFIPYQQPEQFGIAVAHFLDRHDLRG